MYTDQIALVVGMGFLAAVVAVGKTIEWLWRRRTPEKYIKVQCSTCGEEFFPALLVNGVDCHECWAEARLAEFDLCSFCNKSVKSGDHSDCQEVLLVINVCTGGTVVVSGNRRVSRDVQTESRPSPKGAGSRSPYNLP